MKSSMKKTSNTVIKSIMRDSIPTCGTGQVMAFEKQNINI